MIFLLLAVLSSAAIALVLKYFRAQEGNRYGIILGNYLTCIVVSLLMMGDPGAIAGSSSAAMICGFLLVLVLRVMARHFLWNLPKVSI